MEGLYEPKRKPSTCNGRSAKDNWVCTLLWVTNYNHIDRSSKPKLANKNSELPNLQNLKENILVGQKKEEGAEGERLR